MAPLPSSQFTSHCVDLSDVRLHYVVGGKGPTILLIHGWSQTWFEWRKIMPALAENFTVIAPDLRGLGDSGLPLKPTSGYDKRTVAADLKELVDRLDLGPVHVVGHDHGGAVAYAYASNYREETLSLAFIEMALMGVGAGVEEFMDHSKDLREWHLSFHAATDVAEMLIAGKEREYLTWFYKMQMHNMAAMTEEDIDVYVQAYSAPGGLRLEYYATFYEDGRHNAESCKTKLTIPVLAAAGEDHIAELAIRSMNAVAERVEGHIIPECGHWVAEEQPQWLIDHLLDFYRRVDDGSWTPNDVPVEAVPA